MVAFGHAAQDYIEKRIDLNEHCIAHPAATFFMTAEGESLVNAGIHHGALLVIDRSLQARHGDIVIVTVGGEFSIKRLYLRPTLRLEALNANSPPLKLCEGDEEWAIFGVITFSINKLK
ncbi:translesion error-prone DNA polymerase V autoproteolytic subunit [Yersinia hibernica]|uniref:UV protection and mutation protein n=2 Tax=Yersinia TaxID=629 RepID=A0ABX5QYE5_9GAMM|nr:translesion error-prone DNA polymerase V autoproteolytic subunit [Yersinia hibernica]AHM74459.1 UV protection and mutation protein [Yersinia hibernica]OVZ80884.1 UV protection and mutation protein [Yersinia kristensenii]QAX78277.1 UV protection and mutation protein [Yersinia hibernica]